MTIGDKTNYIEKILTSETFANKEVLKGLLNYLNDATKRGKSLKEIDIAIDFFKRDKNFIPGDDTIVRVNIHKLRNLLEKYYTTEGKKDQVIIEIPRGCYLLNFIKKGNQQTIKSNKKVKIKISLIVLLIISIITNLLLIFNKYEYYAKQNAFWMGYFDYNMPVTLILGNPFFYRVSDENIIVRDIEINSNDDLKNSIDKLNGNTQELEYPYFSQNNIWPLPDLLNFFSNAKKQVKIQTLSETNIEGLKSGNHIFIANINSFGFFNKFLESSSIKLHTNPRQIVLLNDNDSTIYSVPELVEGYYHDYAILVKIPGPNHNYITMMGDFHSSGNKGLAHLITDRKTVKVAMRDIIKEYEFFPEFYEMIVKVSSYNHYDVKTEIIYFNPLHFESNRKKIEIGTGLTDFMFY